MRDKRRFAQLIDKKRWRLHKGDLPRSFSAIRTIRGRKERWRIETGSSEDVCPALLISMIGSRPSLPIFLDVIMKRRERVSQNWLIEEINDLLEKLRGDKEYLEKWRLERDPAKWYVEGRSQSLPLFFVIRKNKVSVFFSLKQKKRRAVMVRHKRSVTVLPLLFTSRVRGALIVPTLLCTTRMPLEVHALLSADKNHWTISRYWAVRS